MRGCSVQAIPSEIDRREAQKAQGDVKNDSCWRRPSEGARGAEGIVRFHAEVIICDVPKFWPIKLDKG
jgi:hypothetical protein